MLQRSVPVKLEADERIERDLRRHGMILFVRILPALIILLVPVLIIFVALIISGQDPAQAGALIKNSLSALLMLILPAVAWIGLMVYDWSNDSFHITNRRVIRSDQRLWISRNMQSAMLREIQNVAVLIPDPLANLFNYGTVVIETAAQVGKIEFDSVPDPRRVQRLLFELRGVPMPAEQAPLPHGSNLRDLLLAILPLNPQLMTDGSVVYHKHWFILLQAVGLPLLLIMTTLMTAAVLVSLVPLLMLIVLLPVLAYGYQNWVNDVYILTNYRIIDIVRIPFIREDRREALLERIQNVTVNVPDFGSRLLDMGEVSVETAGKTENFKFKTVENPRAIAEEINRRLDAVRSGQRQAEQDAERKRIEAVVKEILQTQQDAPPPATP